MSGTGADSSGRTVSGTIRAHSDGAYALGVTVDGGAFFSAVYRNAWPGGSEVRPPTCTGDATVLYDDHGEPGSATYGGLEIGAGTVRF